MEMTNSFIIYTILENNEIILMIKFLIHAEALVYSKVWDMDIVLRFSPS